MNQVSEVIGTLVNYKAIIRDTLEYALDKNEYSRQAFELRQKAILIELDQNTPLHQIIKNSKENGEKLEKAIRDMHALIYGKDSTIVKDADDGLRVDHAQKIEIFKNVLPIHENLEAMVRGLINDAQKKGIDVKEADGVDKAEERLYRGVAYMTLVNALVKLFGDYNQARRENKGQESAASRFISSDIQEVIKGLNTVRVNNRVLTDDDYKSTEDDIFHLVEFMTGRRDLPKGKNFGDEIKATQEKIGAYVRTVEPAFRDTFVPFMRALAEQAKKDGNVIKGDDHKAAAPSEGAQNVEIEGEIDPKTGLMKKA